ncbi:MAG: hypothetical protein Q4C13_08170 [Clostridia bacterium]|nr:hypothetical protein [Clostridia bacterium]
MRVKKLDLMRLERCYAVAAVPVRGRMQMIFATEGQGACCAFDLEGRRQPDVWTEPGGTMSIVPVPGRDADFLAVQRFFPTFDAADARIVRAQMQADGEWRVQTAALLPYVHRFDLLQAGGRVYLIASSLCEAKNAKDDWSSPGRVYAGVLPENGEGALKLEPVLDGLVKNHGYSRCRYQGRDAALVTAEEGVFLLCPPEAGADSWTVRQLLDKPASDAVLTDLNGDGRDELVTIEAFHGDRLTVYEQDGASGFRTAYRYERPFEFGHVVCAARLGGVATVVCGCRRAGKELFLLRASRGGYEYEILDEGVGPSNVAVLNLPDRDLILAANREAAMASLYILTKP